MWGLEHSSYSNSDFAISRKNARKTCSFLRFCGLGTVIQSVAIVRSAASLSATEVRKQDLDVLECAAAILKELANQRNNLAMAKLVKGSELLACARSVY